MKILVLVASVAFAMMATLEVHAQGGVPGGISHGFYEGNRRAGPIGAVVGGAVGGVIGGVEGVLGVNQHYYAEDYEDLRPEPAPRIYRHRKHARHAHHHYSRR